MKLAEVMKMFGLQVKDERAEVDLKDTEELKELLSAFDEKETQLIEALDQIDNLNKQLEQFASAKEAAELAAKEVAEKAHAEKMTARKAQMAATLGDDKAEKLMGVVEKMDDAEFDVVFGAQKELADKVDAALNSEAGVDAQVAANKKPAHFKQFIKKQGK